MRRSLVLAVGLLAVMNESLPAADRPNVVLIVADDLGWSDLGCYGSKFHKTPQIDTLAARSRRFTQAYAAAPVCSTAAADCRT